MWRRLHLKGALAQATCVDMGVACDEQRPVLSSVERRSKQPTCSSSSSRQQAQGLDGPQPSRALTLIIFFML